MSADRPYITRDQQRIVNEEMFSALDASNYNERIDLCLKKGADINARNGDGQTLLMRAVWKESPMRVRYVLGKNPDLFLKDGSNRTAFDLNKKTHDTSVRSTITQLLMQAMPDGVPAGSAPPAGHPVADPPVAGAALPEGDIALAPPANVKSRKKGGGPAGGFRL